MSGQALPVPTWLVAIIIAVSLGTAMYHLLGGLFGTAEAFRHRTTHITLFLVLGFLFFPLGRSDWQEKLRWTTVIDFALITAAIGVFIYRMQDVDSLASRSSFPNQGDVISGTILVLLVLEAVRRTVGLALVILPTLFMLHALYSDHFPSIFLAAPTRFSSLIGYLTVDLDGMLGVPIAVSSSFIVIFMMYGAVLVRSGAGTFFTDLAFAATGWMSGGAAKAAALASGLYGTLSGSTTANVVTTGSFTIPLMKSSGFNPRFAASVEAMASNGGQIVPPVMGAAAFIIPMYIPGASYRDVVLAAAIPAVLYYVSILAMIHFQAKRTGLTGVARKDLPSAWMTLRKGWPILIAFGAIVGFLLSGFTPMIAGATALVLTVIVTMFRAETCLTPQDLCAALETGIRATIPIVMACAAAGIIIGSMDLSGLAGRVSGAVTLLADGKLALALVITAVVCVILGMGMTTTIVYITLAALVAPSITEMGAPVMAANLFIFYFGCLSGVTPPVALTTYAAAGIAGSNPWSTGLEAVKVGIASFLIPFMFIYTPSLLLDGAWYRIAIDSVTAAIGIICLAAAVQGYLRRLLKPWERVALAATALLFIVPTWETMLLAGAVLIMLWFRGRTNQGKRLDA
ncbi:TRAP transporter fused permease subunit [Sulfitobacter sp. BDSS02]|nr:TRAP transporter fused permease subunit [Sulfitobacter sp. BDSS02]MBR9849277.1 TRAP transporter fused permease subunit [Paracoccaceae bacterium]